MRQLVRRIELRGDGVVIGDRTLLAAILLVAEEDDVIDVELVRCGPCRIDPGVCRPVGVLALRKQRVPDAVRPPERAADQQPVGFNRTVSDRQDEQAADHERREHGDDREKQFAPELHAWRP